MIYMIMLYGFIPGIISDIALLFNLFFTLGILTSFQAALTMPGIAGIVLTLGTAVDANVLIYERTKEELRRGLGVKESINKGYSNAFSAIFDSNFTSLITGIILLYFGTGPVKGFATTWIIGIAVSFFTAVFLTRLVYENRMKKDKWQNLTFTTPYSRNMMQNTKYNFMGMYKKTFTLWGIAAVVFLGFLFTRGLSQSIDFTGGRNYVVTLDKETHVEDVRAALAGVFVNSIGDKAGQEANTSVIALGTDGKTVRISTNWDIESNNPEVDDQAEDKLYEALTKAGLISQANIADFKNPDVREGGSIISSAKVGPSVAKTITYGAVISVIIALFAIFLYILLRFRNLAYSTGAIVALVLDALVVLGLYSALWGIVPMSLEIDQVFIGAILTVIGYSINDKVVVFDRIRENFQLYGKRDRQVIFNDSLNQTLARTINTSVTTLIVLLCIFILGGDSIRSFSFAMILGVIFGTLSSIFVAAPVAFLVMGGKSIREGEDIPAQK
jgi:SecD/SecF fusion protein